MGKDEQVMEKGRECRDIAFSFTDKSLLLISVVHPSPILPWGC